jgi:ATP:corrinoid adenosyltransferase
MEQYLGVDESKVVILDEVEVPLELLVPGLTDIIRNIAEIKTCTDLLVTGGIYSTKRSGARQSCTLVHI